MQADDRLRPTRFPEARYFVPGTEEDPRVTRLASGYLGGQGAWVRFWTPRGGPLYPFALGSQSLYSTPIDYARFLAMWIDEGRVGDEQILDPEAIRRTLEPVSRQTAMGEEILQPTGFRGLQCYYGRMAQLWVDAAGKVAVIGHGGSDGTAAWAWPDLDLMMLCFTQSRGSTVILRMENLIERLIIHPDLTDTVPAEWQPLLGSYVANYDAHHNEEFVVTMQNGRRMKKAGGGWRQTLPPR